MYPPPGLCNNEPAGQKGFNFDRLGVRVPMVMVSSYLHKNTIINEHYEHASFIKTMCDKWQMNGLTERDKKAPSFAHIFSDQKRADFPDIPEPCIPVGSDVDYENDPLSELQQSILIGASYILDKNQGYKGMLRSIDNIKAVGEAIKYLDSVKEYLQ